MTDVADRVDVVIAGAGPAGLAAACAAREAGKSVLVVDPGMRPGGQIWRHRDQRRLPAKARALIERAHARAVHFALRKSIVDVDLPTGIVVVGAEGSMVQPADVLVIATGARERFLPFPGWTLPGVVGVGGLQALIKNGLDVRGARIVIAGTGPLLFPVAATAASRGAIVVMVAEQAPAAQLVRFGAGLVRKPSAILQAAAFRWQFRTAPFRAGRWVVAAHGDDALREIVLRGPRGDSTIACDLLATGAGLVPGTDLAELAGCEIDGGIVRVDDLQATSVVGIFAAGECTGIKGDAAAIVEGTVAGRAAAGRTVPASVRRRRDAGRAFGAMMVEAFAPREELTALADDSTVICRCENVRRGDIDARWSQRQAKLWTRIGMGECQGAVCGPTCRTLFGWSANAVRPPLDAPLCGVWRAALRAATDEAGR